MPDAKNHVPEVEPNDTTLLDLTSIARKTKAMKDVELFIAAGGYQGYPTTLGLPVVVQVAKTECAGHDRPGFMEIGKYHAEPDTYTCRPVLEQSKSTVPCRWDDDGLPFIDMLPLIIATDTVIPEETHVRIPISRTTLANGQHVMLLHFGKLIYQPVEKGKGKKKADAPAPSSAPITDHKE